MILYKGSVTCTWTLRVRSNWLWSRNNRSKILETSTCVTSLIIPILGIRETDWALRTCPSSKLPPSTTTNAYTGRKTTPVAPTRPRNLGISLTKTIVKPTSIATNWPRLPPLSWRVSYRWRKTKTEFSASKCHLFAGSLPKSTSCLQMTISGKALSDRRMFSSFSKLTNKRKHPRSWCKATRTSTIHRQIHLINKRGAAVII